jgi:D-alanine-D-alanine ligase
MKLSAICRVDYIIKNEVPFIIEINTIPGLSEQSIIPQQLKAANISLSEVFDLCLNNIN